MSRLGPLVVAMGLLGGCAPEPAVPVVETSRPLVAYPNPFGSDDPLWSPQPHRDKPLEVIVAQGKAYVSLQGIPDAPGRHVAVVDVASGRLLTRIEVGSSPTGLALHPEGRWLVVCNRFGMEASVIDTSTDRVVHTLPTGPYAIEAAFTPDGEQLVFTDRWRDAVRSWRVRATSTGLVKTGEGAVSASTGSNPRDVVVSEDGSLLAAAALTGLTVAVVDVGTGVERHQIAVGAPPNGLAFVGSQWLLVATTSASTHHEPFAGPDTDHDGQPGDGTPNVNFQDLQNDLAVYRMDTGEQVFRYTSDSICCRDYRDVDPGDQARFGDHLPPKERWIVGGALPEQVIVAQRGDDTVAYVTYSASNQMQRFDVDTTNGSLKPGPVWPTAGHAPHGLAVAGDNLLVAHRLGETLGIYDADSGALRHLVVVGDVVGGEFPATDAEIGELFNYVTGPFTVDGDGSCAHCHREDGNIDKAFSMPLTLYGGVGSRMTMAYRGAADTRPWFFESAMDHTNFKPVMNELARIENFCCSDYTLWTTGAPSDCASNPPAECTTAGNAYSRDGFAASREVTAGHPRPTGAASRDRFYLDVSAQVIGRTESFGDGLFFEDPISGDRRPLKLDFDGITRALGLFLLTRTRLLPNPNPINRASVRRGRELFESTEVGCAFCHPAPTFAITTSHNPFDLPLRMGPVVSPTRSEAGTNVDLLSGGFIESTLR